MTAALDATVRTAATAVELLPSNVRFYYPMRIVGYLWMLATVAATVAEREPAAVTWLLAAATALLWPHLAYRLVRASADPKAAELRNMLIDCGIAGLYVNLCSFSLLPSGFIVAVGLLDCLGTGGFRLALRGLLTLIVSAIAWGGILGFQFVANASLVASIISLGGIFTWAGLIGGLGYANAMKYRRARQSTLAQAAELKRAVANLEQARAAAEAGSRAKSQFLAKMSHELRTPMNAIIGFSDLALRDVSGERRQEHLQHIGSASRTLLHIINDVLDFSKIEAGKLQLSLAPFSVEPLLRKCLDLVHGLATSKGLELKLELSPAVPPALIGDALRLEQVLMNLLSNAVKFTETGRVTLVVQPLAPAATVVDLEFAVRDSGIGLSPDQLGRLFQPFTQADDSTTRRYGGTGLGLAISRQLVELMGGQLRVVSQPGRGSEFGFSIRLEVAATAPSAGAEAPRETIGALGQQQRLHGLRVLLVEDNAMNRRLAREILREAGLIVDVAEHGRLALAAVQQESYDVVLMDVQMPEMDGLEATRAIRALPGYGQLPIIAMTANAYDEDRTACVDAGMNDFLAKPIDAEQVLTMVARWAPADRVART
jgi:signal transduction histidine kinase/CheY-like chemotaxis protein